MPYEIILQGKVFGQARGRDYQKLKPQLLWAVLESFETVKNGESPLTATSPETGQFSLTPTPVKTVIDTTAAGDSFAAGLLLGLFKLAPSFLLRNDLSVYALYLLLFMVFELPT